VADEEFDVVVIGGGAPGEVAAGRIAAGGLRTALVEAELFGGECSYWACMPSKALLRPGALRAAARRVPGVRVDDDLDTAAVLERRTSFTSNWDDSGQVEWVEGAGITPVRGRARITAERRVTVETADGATLELTAKHAVVVVTGSTPSIPPLDGIDEVEHWTSREATSAKEVPESLVVLGGGVVGVEMAQAWAWLGARVSLVVSGERPLPRLEPFAGDLVADGLREAGVTLHLNSRASGVRKTEDGVELVLADGSTVAGRHLLIATGRRPNTADLGLGAFGVEPGAPLATDDQGRVSAVDGGWLWALGDVTGRALLTHQGKYQGRIFGDALVASVKGGLDPLPWSKHSATADHVAVPQVVFTDPEVASVGRGEAEAREAGLNVRVVTIDLAVAGSSVHADGYRGKASIVVDEEKRTIVGATFVGQDVAELLHASTVAIVGEVPLDRLWHAVPAYPTISEIYLRLLEAYGL
jgi:dihydrolipoamide dehydrogenase